LEHFFRVDSLVRIDGLALDVEKLFGENWWSLVNGDSGSVEGPT
jgi:hypothetical protein